MVAIVTGNGLGILPSSAFVLGSQGQLGSAGLGRANENVFVNAANGNLILTRQDELLTGRGPDALVNRTYNSLGLFDDDNGDNWRPGTARTVLQASGAYGGTGSTVTRTDWDGSNVVYSWNATRSAYVSKEGAGAFDEITLSNDIWTWTDGDSRATETYDKLNLGRITYQRDADGNQVQYYYGETNPALISNVFLSNGESVNFLYSGNQLIRTTTTKLNGQGSYVETRTYYEYTGNRLTKVKVDLSPEDNNITDGRFYEISYTYVAAGQNGAGKVATITQSDGSSLTIGYDSSGRVSSLSQAMSGGATQLTSFVYDSVNRITTITDGFNNVTKLTFDIAGQLTRMEKPAPFAGATETIDTFSYDADGNVTEVLTFDTPANVGNASLAIEIVRSRYDGNGNMLEQVRGDGSSVFYTYGSLNQLLTETRYTGFDTNLLADNVAPTGDMTTRYIYDDASNGVSDEGTGSGDDAAEKHLRFAISPEGRVTEYRYDGYGRLTSMLSYSGTPYAGSDFTEAGLTSWMTSSADKLQVQRVDNTYDFRGNLSTVKSWSATNNDGSGASGSDWSLVTYVYDGAGRLLSRVVSGTNALGGEAPQVLETFVYDGLGRVISSSDLYGQTTVITINDGTRVTTIATPNDPTRTLSYNVDGSLASEAISAPGITTSTTTYSYDKLGRLRYQTDALGVKTYYVYDRQNRLTATIDTDGSISEIKYDAAGRIIATVAYEGVVSAANIVTLGNAAVDKLVADIRPTVSTADRWSWNIYDKAGKLTQTIDGAGAVVRIDYDGSGRLITKAEYYRTIAPATLNGSDGLSGYRTTLPTAPVLPAAEPTYDRITRNLYDGEGLLIGALDGDGYLSETIYDKAGRKVQMIQYTQKVPSALRATGTFQQIKAAITPVAATDINNYWLYDGRGRVAATIDGEGSVTRYHYTVRGDLDQEVRGNKVNPNPTTPTLATLNSLLLTGSEIVLETTTFTRNAAGQILTQRRDLAGGQQELTSYSYDNRGRILSTTVSETVSTETRTQTFRYDAKGRLIGQLNGNGSAALAALGANPTQTAIDNVYAIHGTRYVYDAADRLIQKITSDGSSASGSKTLYYYDSDGNLRFEIAENKYWSGTNWIVLGGEVVETRYNSFEDRYETIGYGSRISASTMTSLSGGLVDTAIINALLPVAQGGIADATRDSQTRYGYDNRGWKTVTFNPNYWQNPGNDNFANITYFPFGEPYITFDPAGSNGSSGPSGFSGFGVSAWDIGQHDYNARGLERWQYHTLVNSQGATVGGLRRSFGYDAFGRLNSYNPNSIDGVARTAGYDRANRQTSMTDRMGVSSSMGYDARSNMISSTDRTNRTTTYSYDQFSRNVTTTSAEGIVTRVKKNAFGQVIQLDDGKGNITRYEYDKNGNLTKVIEDYGTAAINPVTGKAYLNLTTINSFDNADRLIEVTDAKGVKTRYSYDALGRVLTEVRDFGTGTSPISQSAFLNITTRTEYDAKGQAIKVTDAIGTVTTYSYDLKGQRVRTVEDAGTGNNPVTGKAYLNITTDFVYGANGKVTKQIDAAGTAQQRVTLFEYDSRERLTRQVEDWGDSSKLNIETKFLYDANDNMVAQTDALGRTTRYVYDLENRLVLSINAMGEVVYTGRDAEGRVSWTREYLNVATTAQLNAMVALTEADQTSQWNTASVDVSGNLTIVRKSTGSATTVATINVTASDRVTRSFYDADGRAVYSVDGEGYVTQNVYDKASNVIQTIRYTLQTTSLTNASTTASIAALFGTTLNNGALATNIPADAAVTTMAYDAANRLTDVTDAVQSVTHFELDALGQIVETHYAFGSSNPNDVSITKNVFDNVGRVTSEIRGFGTAEQATTSYHYDALGRVAAVTDARLNVTTFTYDALGRLTRQTVPLNPSPTTWAITDYEYDARGNRVKVIDPRGNVSFYFYDNVDRMTLSVDAEGYATETKYLIGSVISWVRRYANATVNLSAVSATAKPVFVSSAPGGSSPYILLNTPKDARTAFKYDLAYRLTSTIDAEGLPDANGDATVAGFTETYGLDAFGNRLTITNKLGGVTTNTYDRRGLLKTSSKLQNSYLASDLVNAAGTSVVTTYSYDARGNLLSTVEGSNLAAAHQRTTSFVYDKVNRVRFRTDQAIQGQTPITEFQYDKRGNVILTIAADLGKTYSYYDDSNRKIAEINAVGTLTHWVYDANGNVTSQKIYAVAVPIGSRQVGGSLPTATITAAGASREIQYEYDRSNRLTKTIVMDVRTGSWDSTNYNVLASQNVSSSAEYDAAGNVIKETDAIGNVIHHFYDRNGREYGKLDAENYLTIWERDSEGNVLKEIRYASATTATAANLAATGYAALKAHGDGLADPASNRTTRFDYDRNGRRVAEYRDNVLAATISGNSIASLTSQTATIQYGYNALGEVTHRIEANGDRTDYDYDNQGRLTRQRDVVISDWTNTNVRKATYFYYDGLDNVAATVERAIDPGSTVGAYASGYSALDDRTTRFSYDGGKLASTIDATGFERKFGYDIMGRQTHSFYRRTLSSGALSANEEASITSYDLAGRIESTKVADRAFGASVWNTNGPISENFYNSFGEVTSRSIGGASVEQNIYDNAGRVIKTNSGDGTWKHFVYDANGNATLTISSAGADLSGVDLATMTQTQITTLIGQLDVNGNYAVYDKRNMVKQSVEEGRQLVAGLTTVTITNGRTYNAFGEVASETDARSNTTNYAYNNMGRVIRKIAPAVEAVRENGQIVWIRPTEDYYYDISGRLVAMRDAQDRDTGNGVPDWSYEQTASAGTSATNASIKKADRGYLTTRILLAGTGHATNGDDALVVKEYRPDGSDWESLYDAYRDMRTSKDGLDRATLQSFDKMGRITQITRPSTAAGTLIESYEYDGLGRRTRAWNNHYGSTEAATNDYDALGRVISTRAQGGDVTGISYTYSATLSSGSNLGTFGGWVETTTYANTKTSISRADNFGREVEKTDMGGHITTFAYDRGGRLNSQTTSAVVQNFTWFNTGQLASNSGPNGTETYTYDANGNRLTEYLQNGNFVKNSAASYDALGRLATWNEYGTPSLPSASTINSYDAVGNIRRTQATHYNINAYGDPNGFAPPKDYWYRFDALNRVVLDKGSFDTASSSIVRGSGTSYEYDAAGQRVASIETAQFQAHIDNPDYDGSDNIPQYLDISYSGDRRTQYGFDNAGRLAEVRTADAGYADNGNGTVSATPPAVTGGTLRSSLQYDLVGRLSLQQDYGGIASLPTTVTYSRTISYNAKNQILVDDSTTMRLREGSSTTYDSWRTITRNDFDADGNLNTQAGSGYALGSIIWQHGQTYKNGDTNAIDDTMTRFDYVWWESAVQSGIVYDKHYGWSINNGPTFNLNNFNTNFTTTYTLNGLGQTIGAQVRDGVAKNVAYTLDGLGQIVKRDETRVNASGTPLPNEAAPVELFYRFAGKTMGMVGNNGTGDVNYDASITARSAASPAITSTNAGLFRNGTNTGSSFYADFSQSIDPYNSGQQGSAGGGTYTVRSGDTLQAIAASLYGDGNLWYRIAEANGLSAGAALSEGQSLILPAGVTKNTHNASTFQPYDASEALGDTLPTTPKPPKTPKCGAFGQFIVAAIAIAVVALTQQYQIFAALGPVLGGAAGAAAGSIVSQGFGVATGIQDKFSFKNVALSALSGAVGAGVGQIAGTGAAAGSQFVGDVLRGAAGSALTQGIATATGLQNKFSWTGVAVAGIGAGIAGAVTRGLSKGYLAKANGQGVNADGSMMVNAKGDALNFTKGSWVAQGDPGFGAHAAATMADTIAQAATRSAIKGNSFGGNLLASLPSALGNLAGRALASGIGTAFDGKSSDGNTLAVVEAEGNAMADEIITTYSKKSRIILDGVDVTDLKTTTLSTSAGDHEGTRIGHGTVRTTSDTPPDPSDLALLAKSLNLYLDDVIATSVLSDDPENVGQYLIHIANNGGPASLDAALNAETASKLQRFVGMLWMDSRWERNGADTLGKMIADYAPQDLKAGDGIVETLFHYGDLTDESGSAYFPSAYRTASSYVYDEFGVSTWIDFSVDTNIRAGAAAVTETVYGIGSLLADSAHAIFPIIPTYGNTDEIISRWKQRGEGIKNLPKSILDQADTVILYDDPRPVTRTLAVTAATAGVAKAAGPLSKLVPTAAERVAPSIVYRGLTEADSIALQSGRGLTAKAPNGTWSAAEHVANSGPGAGGAAANSPWISTSKRLDVAQAYDSGHGVVAIDLNRVGSLQVEVWQTAPRVKGTAGLPYHRSIWAQEVTIHGTIPREAIIWPK